MMNSTHKRERQSTRFALAWLVTCSTGALASIPAPSPMEADAAWAACAPFQLSSNYLDVGFVASQDVTLETNKRFRAIGPIIEWQEDPQGQTFRAVRPFFSRTSDPSSERVLTDILWPAGQVRRTPDELSWRFLLAYGQDMEPGKEESHFRAVLFPILFYGRDANDEKYMAVFPLGGKLHEYLGYDKINFVLFPLYAKTQRVSVTSRSVLWPLVTWATGKDSKKLRLFPFYGKSTKDDQWTRKFVLWPFWTSARYHYEHDPGSAFVLFPLVGHSKSTKTESWMFLPPFIRFSKGDAGVERLCPWPFIQYKKTDDTDKMYVWPLWGTRKSPNVKSTFYAWPVFWKKNIARKDVDISSFKALPFFHHETTVAARETDDSAEAGKALERYWKLWPLMSYQRTGDASRLRVLALWPTKRARAVEQNLAPFWTLYSRQSEGPRFEEELLWGLYRRSLKYDGTRNFSLFPVVQASKDDAGDRRWSLLGGILGYERKQLRRRATLLYFIKLPLGQSRENPDVLQGIGGTPGERP